MDELATRAALFEAQCGAAVPVQPKTTVFVHNDVPYTHEFLSRAMERHAQRVIVAPDRTSAPLDLQIDEYEEILWDEVLKGRLVANAYCVRKGLIRKANFATAMSRSMGKRPNAVLSKGIPRTLVLNTWEAFAPSNTPGFGYIDLSSALASCLCEAEECMESSPGKLWILKPSLANKGAEVTVVSSFDTVLGTVKLWRDVREWVLQEYLERPLLIARRKFHLRVYVLAVGALKVFVYREALVLIAMHPFDLATPDDPFSHLTNTCVSMEHEDFKESSRVKRLSDLQSLLRRQGTPEPETLAKSIYSQIRCLMAHTFHALRGDFSAFMPLLNAFELFGVDFLVDESGSVILLEFNSGPDLKMTGSRLDYIISDMLKGMVDTVLTGGHFPSLQGQEPASSPTGSPVSEPVVDIVARDEDPGSVSGWDMVYSQVWPVGSSSFSFA